MMDDITVNKAIDGTFLEFTIRARTDIVDPDESLRSLLKTPRALVEKGLEKFNCLKFYIVCEARFQVCTRLSR